MADRFGLNILTLLVSWKTRWDRDMVCVKCGYHACRYHL